MIEFIKNIWRDPERRLYWSTGISAFWNLFIALQNGVSSIRYKNYWFGSFSAYYFLLGAIRIIAVIMILRKEHKDRQFAICSGIAIILISIVLGTTVDIIYRTGAAKSYATYWIYAAALYTFWKFISGIINLIHARKNQDHFISSLRAVSYTDALVSMVMLQASMMAAFSPDSPLFNATFNHISGGIFCVIIFAFGLSVLIPELKGR